VPAGPTGHVQHPPARLQPNRAADQGDGSFRIGVVAVRVQLEVFFAEPLFEPFSHLKP
jgi:hypothetical protein